MNTSKHPIDLSAEEAAKIAKDQIEKGVPADDMEVEAQGEILVCGVCAKKYWNSKKFQYSMCPYCGSIKKWW